MRPSRVTSAKPAVRVTQQSPAIDGRHIPAAFGTTFGWQDGRPLFTRLGGTNYVAGPVGGSSA